MKNILEELYLGNLRPLDHICPDSEEYKAACGRQVEKIDDLIAKLERLDPSLKEEFLDILNMEGEVGSYEVSQAFIVGFRLSTMIMFAALANN